MRSDRRYGNKRDLATLASRVGRAIEQTLSEGPSEGRLGQPTPRLAIPLTNAVSLIEERRSALADLVPEKWSVSAQTWVAQTETLLLRLFGDGHLLIERVSVIDFSPYMRPVGVQYAPSGWRDLFKAAREEGEALLDIALYELRLSNGD